MPANLNMLQEKQFTFNIVVTGPESTGKTTLTQALARALQTHWVPEFARYYLGGLCRPYEKVDLARIGAGQKAWENWYARTAGPVLLRDTDWTVLHIWEQYRFGPPVSGTWNWQQGYGDAQNADLYLLCAPDFPWQPDPLREHPLERDILFDAYETLLAQHRAHVLPLRGTAQEREAQALAYIRKVF